MSALFIGVFLAALDTSVIAPAIPALRAQFNLDNRTVGLVIIVFVLCSMCSTAPLASLGDRHGRRPVYLASVSLFALGSLVIALSSSFWALLVGRAIQGVGGGGIIPTASAVIGDVFTPEKRARALGLIGATYGMAFVLGPPLAGLVMVVASWQWIFVANIPIAAAVIWRAARVMPARARSGELPPLDWQGIVAVFVLLSALVLGLTHVLDSLLGLRLWPWALLLTTLMLPVLLWVESRAAQPLIPLGLFARPQLALAYALTLGAGFSMGGVIFLTSVATLAHGVAKSHAGFVLLPMVLCSMLGSMGSGRLLNRLGSRILVVAGFGLTAVGYAATAMTSLGLWGFLLASMPVGLGIGVLVSGALRTIAIDEAPVAQRGAAQGLVNIFTSIGTLLSAAAIGALADWQGGGTAGFAGAYGVVAALMLVLLLLALGLRRGSLLAQPAKAAS